MDEKERDEMNSLLAVADGEEEAEEVIDVNEVLAKLAPEQRTIIIKAFMAMKSERSFRGPLPAPEDFKAYGEVIENAPERILSMTEQQVKHRINTEDSIVKSGLAESRRGQWMGLFYCLGVDSSCCTFGYEGARLGGRSYDDCSDRLSCNLCVAAEPT